MKNPLTLEAFAEWLEKQPQEKEYDFLESRRCLIAQYFRACGFEDWHRRSIVAGGTFDNPFISVAVHEPWTFGAAARRARALIARDTSLGMRAEDVS